ncbi:hypothetical protein Cni_G18760 [Canna indica]|uniref:Uncharacterized protein n=1 Tax=Canna indica TaxID=4628 RepID=A0AAQ3QHW2_9LILI|nr:hypothetical protein Cni_G18760 [Canna indica]
METTFDRQISLERGIGVIEVEKEKEKEKEKEAGKGSYRDKAPPHILSQNGSRSGVVGATSGIFAMEKEVGSTRSPRGQATPRVLTPNGKNYLGGPGATSGTGDQRKGDFSMFRTKSTLGMVSRQNSFLLMRRDTEQDHQQQADGISAAAGTDDMVHGSVPAGRYFAALRGPELDQVRDYEDILLPKDEVWPFLLRFPIGCFGVSLGIGSLANLWGALALSPAMAFLQINLDIHFALWLLTLAVFISVAITYTLKCIFYFEAIRREYYHPVRVNFFFAPWVGCMFLAMGAPRRLAPERLHPAVWCCLITPVIILELKMYGQWLSGGKHRLSKVANPSSHLAVVGNFIGAMLAAKVGWLEAGKFLWAVGLAHYLCVFVTLYQRLPSSEALPKELHPVYSMFIATPMAASISWSLIHGRFDEVSRIFYFTALFLYCTLLILVGVVVVHISPDDGVDGYHQVRGRGAVRVEQGAGGGPLVAVVDDRVGDAGVDSAPCISLAIVVPE